VHDSDATTKVPETADKPGRTIRVHLRASRLLQNCDHSCRLGELDQPSNDSHEAYVRFLPDDRDLSGCRRGAQHRRGSLAALANILQWDREVAVTLFLGWRRKALLRSWD
jgi:hypothetical protein